MKRCPSLYLHYTHFNQAEIMQFAFIDWKNGFAVPIANDMVLIEFICLSRWTLFGQCYLIGLVMFWCLQGTGNLTNNKFSFVLLL